MTKKAVIQNITKKEFNEQYKNWSYGLKLDNGDEGFLSCKKEFSGGDEIEYEIEEAMSKAGKPYNKIKLPSTGYIQPRGGGGFQKASESEKYPSFALAYAKDAVVAMMQTGAVDVKSVTSSDIAKVTCNVADAFLEWLNAHKS